MFLANKSRVRRLDDGAPQVVPGGIEICLGRQQLGLGLLQLRFTQVQLAGLRGALGAFG